MIYKILQKMITQYESGLKVTRKQQVRSTRVSVLISEFCVLIGEAANTINIIWFDLTGARTHDLLHSRRERLSFHN